MLTTLTRWLKSPRRSPRLRRIRLGVEAFEPRDMPSAVTGTVWHDVDRNGVHDSFEEGVPGVGVRLSSADGTFVADGVTYAGGVYQFAGVAAGSYRLQVIAPTEPADLQFTTRGAGGDPTRDSDVDETGFSDLFAVGGGETRSDQSAGLWSPGNESGFSTVVAQLRATAVPPPPLDPPLVWLDAPPQTLAEGGAAGFWAYRSGGDTSQPLTVNLSVGGDAQGDPLAAWGEDYVLSDPVPGEAGGWSPASPGDTATFSFGADETAVYLGIRALTDALVEPTEGVRLALQPGGGYEIGFGVGPAGTGWATAAEFCIADAPAAATVLPSNLMVRADQAAEWVRRLSAPGKEITTVGYQAGSDYVRLVLPDAARNQADHDRIRDVFVRAGVQVGDAAAPVQEALNALYRGAIVDPPGYGDRFIVFNYPDGLADLFTEPVAAATPSNLLVRGDQAMEWVNRLSAPGAQVTLAAGPAGSEYVRLVLPDSQRFDAAHDRIAGVFAVAGLNSSRPGGEAELGEAVKAIYRGNVENPPGYGDRYAVFDPDTGLAYLSSVPDFGLSRLSGDLSRVREYRLAGMVRDGLAQKVGDSFYVAWIDLPAGLIHRIVMEPFAEEMMFPGVNADPSIPEEAAGGSSVVYRPVLRWTIPLGATPAADAFAGITSPTAAANAVAAVAARREGRAIDGDLRAATIALNGVQVAARVAPLTGTVFNAIEGEYREAVISAGGDLTLIFGLGVATKAVQGSRVVRAVLVASAAYDATVAVYRAGQGVDAALNEDYIGAASRFGQAGLSLIGLRANTAAYLKAVGKSRAEARLAADRAAAEVAAEATARTSALAAEAADGGHSLVRHGPELTDDVLRRRVTEGIAADGVFSPQQFSTRFKDYQTWLRTRDAAVKQLEAHPDYRAIPGPGDEIRLPIQTAYAEPIGSGFRGRETTQRNITTDGGRTGRVYGEVDAITVYRVTTVFEWDATLMRWKAVQHYPDGRL